MTVSVIKRAALDSQEHYVVRQAAEAICQGIRSKDYLSEIAALTNAVQCRTRYMRDPRTVELVRAPYLAAGLMLRGGVPQLDCLPVGTLLLRDDYRLVPIEQVTAGTKIWGLDRWTEVRATLFKGILPVDVITLNNGSSFRATKDHKVYVNSCGCTKPNKACDCRTKPFKRIRVAEVEPGMILATPERLPFGTERMDPDRAYVEGLYLSDGWHQRSAFAISGQDGCPKEAQKREVETICARLGIPTKWYRKSIHVKSKEWAIRVQEMGARAPQKHALSINLDEGAAGALLRGILADSGKNTHGAGRTFTTTSRDLMLQTRLLLKMFGRSCGERYIVDHGGLGENPIWRLGLRAQERADGRREKVLRVKHIDRHLVSAPVYDLETDDHYVYLPEADVTVSNCDDMSALLAALFLAVGCQADVVTCAFRHMFYQGRRQFSHVFARAKEPRSGTWVVCDPVAGPDTESMLKRIVAAKVWPIA